MHSEILNISDKNNFYDSNPHGGLRWKQETAYNGVPGS